QCQDQSLPGSVQRGKKRRVFPLSINAVICLNQDAPQLLLLIQEGRKEGKKENRIENPFSFPPFLPPLF
ncbi:hypothetical protein, partial [Larkinella punicea]|uniref:hypothetical protein n=1 Tax=Larkinella punicea TaxID=2315727 RepID=UPI001CA39C60